MPAAAVSHLKTLHWVAAAVVGGYALAWGVVALGIALLFAAGVEFHEAEALAWILGLVAFLPAFLWAFAVRSVTRVWLVLAGGGAAMAGVASLVQRLLVVQA